VVGFAKVELRPLSEPMSFWQQVLLLLCVALPQVRSDYFPFKGEKPLYAAVAGGSIAGRTTRHSAQWQPPLLQPWDPLRSTSTSITVSWTAGWNPWCDVAYYELQARRPAGHPLKLASRLGLQYGEADTESDIPFEQKVTMQDEAWTQWGLQYKGRGRVFTKLVELGTPHAVQFRVRACGKVFLDGCSEWTPVQTTHTVLSAAQDKVNFHIRGTGKNAHNYTVIEINRITIYKRRDETGLVLAVFSRLDFSLQWLRTYDTHRNRSEALLMSKDIRRFNQTFFIVVASAIAWEWHAPQSLVKTMEFCGAYHFGQWAHIFGEQKHYESPASDLQQTASQEEFGHPYAFIGIPGIGTGNGWESLMHNTGHYLPINAKPQEAVIRGVSYYDYVFRLYRMQDVFPTKSAFYMKATPPSAGTFHNPIPQIKRAAMSSNMPISSMLPSYVPYVGSLQKSITVIIEANETVPPFNFAFLLVTSAEVRYTDPRPRNFWVTEIERIWEGSSARYFRNGTLFATGLALYSRSCVDFVYHDFNFASPELCGDNFTKCCDKIDVPQVTSATTEGRDTKRDWMACSIGIAPTLCKNSEKVMQVNQSKDGTHKWPFPFRVIDWTS